MLSPVNVRNWVAFTPPQDVEKTRNFIRVLRNIGKELGAAVAEPMDV
jgi:hypothetical protein